MSILKYLRNKNTFVFIFLLIANLLLINLPLANSLGYEFCFVNAVLLFIIAGFHSLIFFKKNQNNIILYVNQRWKVLSTFITIPFVIGFISSILISRCPIKDGVGFYFVVTIPAFIYGMLLGSIVVFLSKKYSIYIFILSFILLLAVTLWEFYFNPQIYFYNPIYGFYPGTIYDEDVSIDWKLILSQIYNLVIFCGILISLYYAKQNKRVHKIILTTCIMVVFIISIFLKPYLGFATNDYRLEKSLQEEISTKHFTIHFGSKIDQQERTYIALLHEYYYDQVCTKLKVNYKTKISSYIFNNRYQKRELFGSGNADVAKPWMNKIFLNYENYEGTLKHEMAHVIAGQFGSTIFKVASGLNPALIEGLAMFAEDNFDGYPIDYAAQLAWNSKRKINLENIFSGLKFFTSYSTVSYIYSGAFINYLYNQYGIEKIKQLYQQTDFKNVYNEDLDVLARSFEKTLKAKDSLNANQAQLYFGGQTIFKKFCPRMASNDIKIASEYFQQKNYLKAAEIYRNVYGYSGSYQSLVGEITTLNKQKNYSEAASKLNLEIKKFCESQSFYNLELILADTYILGNDLQNGNRLYDSLIIRSPHIVYNNEIKLRRQLLNLEGIDSLKSYLVTDAKGRLAKLSKLINQSFQSSLVPRFISFARSLKYDLSNRVENFKNELRVTDYESSYAAFQISKICLRAMQLNNAHIFAIKALEYKGKDYETFALVENLRMVNWFVNFAEETKASFRK